jgi:CspA family cold shock protein
MFTGTVKWFNAEKGYGFITCDQTKDDVFVIWQSIECDGFKNLDEQDNVSFKIVQGKRGPNAENVQIISKELKNQLKEQFKEVEVTKEKMKEDSFNVSLEFQSKEDFELFVALINLGIVSAMQEGTISLDNSENILYNPYTADKLKKLKVNESLVQAVKLGCELEDVKSLVPDKLFQSINEIKGHSSKVIKNLNVVKNNNLNKLLNTKE